MKWIVPTILLAMVTLPPAACAPSDADASEQNPVLKQRAERFNAAVADSNVDEDKPIARWVLPDDLSEISGLTLTRDGRLLAHGDETGEVAEIDYRRGIINKRFLLGEKVVRDDFEGITTVDDRYFMMTSKSKLYEFREGVNKATVPYEVHDAGLAKDCEFEGVAYDPSIKSLLLPCKVVNVKDLEDRLVIYRWSLDSTANPRVSTITTPLKDIGASQKWDAFHSSDITVDPKTGNYVLTSAQEKGLIVIKPDGELVSTRQLDDVHNQVEGIAITRDGVLILSDEIGKQKPAAITLYRWK